MNFKLNFLVLVFLCLGLHCIAQPRFLQQEIDRNGNISFAQLRTDTVPQPLSKSVELLKNLYPAGKADEFKLSDRRKEMQDELGYTLVLRRALKMNNLRLAWALPMSGQKQGFSLANSKQK